MRFVRWIKSLFEPEVSRVGTITTHYTVHPYSDQDRRQTDMAVRELEKHGELSILELITWTGTLTEKEAKFLLGPSRKSSEIRWE